MHIVCSWRRPARDGHLLLFTIITTMNCRQSDQSLCHRYKCTYDHLLSCLSSLSKCCSEVIHYLSCSPGTGYLQLCVRQNSRYASSNTNSRHSCSSTNLVLMIAVSFAIVWHHCDCSQWVRHRLEIPRRIYLILTYVKCFQKHAVKLLLNVENS